MRYLDFLQNEDTSRFCGDIDKIRFLQIVKYLNAHCCDCVCPTSPLSGTSQLDTMGLEGGYLSSIGNKF